MILLLIMKLILVSAYDDDNVWGRSTTEGGGERTRTSAAVEFALPLTFNLIYI